MSADTAPAAMPDHIPDTGKMVSAPAAMPGEAIRRIIEDALCEPNTVEFAVASLEALFAPVLAEKERDVKEAMREAAKWATEAGEAKGRLEVSELASVVEGWRDRALAAEAALAAGRAETVKRIAEVAAAVGWQANAGASETAGLIVSVLAANPEHTERFMAEGSELFIDGTMRAENGCLSHFAMNGQIVSPTKLRMMKGQSQ